MEIHLVFENSPQPYDGKWPELFKKLEQEILAACGENVVGIEHIGSTSIAGLCAKPIIDILIEVAPGKLSALTTPLTGLGYISKDEYGIQGRSYFNRPRSQDYLGVHVHAFETGNSNLVRHIAFRDYLRAHPTIAQKYRDLKNQILQTADMTGAAYQNLKSSFIDTADAIEWYGKNSHLFKKVRKAVLYGLRKNQGRLEVLVFDQIKYPGVNPQVPSGTIEKGEDISTGAQRELFEESGIKAPADFQLLGSYVFYKDHLKQYQERFIFAFNGQHLPETWIHTVTGAGVDQNLEFKYYWKSVKTATTELQVHLGDGLSFFAKTIENLI
jgi:GrpB-like predicted nucleotidyltransferase (UPF0157 family)